MADLFGMNSGREPVPSARQRLSDIFVEEPVSLDVFIADKKFLDNPPLSPIQYDAVRHIEQVLNKDTYDLMAEGFGSYWKPKRFINYATLVFGKGCILPDEEIYDPSTGQWVAVKDCQGSEGFVSSYQPHDDRVITDHRTASYPHGVGSCVEVETRSGRVFRVYEGHQVYAKPRLSDEAVWISARYLNRNFGLVLPTSVSCQNPVELSEDELWVLALWVQHGSIATADQHKPPRSDVLIRYGEILERILGEKLYLESKFTWDDLDHWPTSLRTSFDEWLAELGVEHKQGVLQRLPKILFSLTDECLATFFRYYHVRSAWFGDVSHWKARVRDSSAFLLTFTVLSRQFAVDLSNLLMRFNVMSYMNPSRLGFSSEPRRENFRRGLWTVRVQHEFDLHNYMTKVPDSDSPKTIIRNFYSSFAEKADPSIFREGRQSESVVVDKVMAVRSIGIQEFWNLSVDRTEHYLGSGGVLHHNSGKDHVCRVASLRIAYLLQCLRSPQDYFGLPSQDTIHMLNVAATSRQANQAYFNPLKRVIDRGWFADKAQPVQNGISWAKGIEMISGHSDAESQEGLNLILGIADELDAFKSDNDTRGSARSHEYVNSAEAIVKMMHSSAKTRFPENFKVVHISYPRYVGSPILQLLAEANEDIAENKDKSVYYAAGPYATWEVNPRIKDKSFFASDYKKDPVAARARYECRPERAINPYYRNGEAIKSCMRQRKSPLDPRYRLEDRDGGAQVWVPEYDFDLLVPKSGAQYVIHADLAVRHDRAGIAMAHVIDWKDIESVQTDDEGAELSYWETRPNVYLDFVFGFEADLSKTPEREIQIRWYRQLISDLRLRGFNIVRASADGFQSTDSLQILEAQGVRTKKISADVNDGVWKNLKDLLYEGRVSLPNSKLLYEELTALMQMPNGKIDHPPGTTGKDLADAVACACLSAVEIGGRETGEEASLGFDFSMIRDAHMQDPYGLRASLADNDNEFDFLI